MRRGMLTPSLRRASCVLASIFCIACGAVALAAPAPGKALPLAVRVNGSPAGNWILLEQDGALYAQADAFEEWRVMRPKEATGIAFRNQMWYSLESVPGYSVRRDFAAQSVDLTFSPTAFAATQLGSEPAARPDLTPAVPALFLNYDVNVIQAYSRFAASSREIGALGEIGFASGLGVFTSSFVAPSLPGSINATSPGVRRLETSFTRDFAEHNLTVRVGDSITRGVRSGRSVYFGGVQIAKNFALSPGLIRQPVPVIAGVSSSPSTLSLYINDALRQVSEVPAGPFAIENFPVLTGAGEARVVTRDLLGRETIVVQRFFTDPSLL
ncbi:MAG: fimbrial biosis outer rane usher protein, partial [Noviherbaspirillum sp.]|nr:fimbrial biosis outer rane usher protein [Noviherbaspirillum sp.]